MVDKEWHKYGYSLIFNFFSKKKVLEVAGSSPGGPTRNENTNLRVGIFLSVTLSNGYTFMSLVYIK